MIIIHTTCHKEFGGLEKRIYNESCKMAEMGHTMVIVAPKNSPLILRCSKLSDMGFITVPMGFTPKSAIKDYFALKRLYKKLKPNVLNTHGNIDSKVALLAAFGQNPPIFCKILSRHISAHVKPSWYNKILYNRLCSVIFTTADYTTAHLIKSLNIAPNRVFTMPSGVVLPDKLPTKDEARAELLKELNLDSNIDSNLRFIGFVGRVSEDKGVGTIIEAFLSIAEKIPNYHLVFVGKAEAKYIESLKEIINQSLHKNKIHFIGFKEDTWGYYRAFDCKILASKEVEGISQSLLEAMYARCPVAASKIGGNCNIIKDGQTGLIFKPDSAKEIAEAILKILSDKSKTDEQVKRAFKMVKDKYTIDSMIEKTLKIYKKFTLEAQ
ncbi:MAG: glycosyltransferase family 4 protein [Desulfamplus sp.]|nr:glycosyltransferase family 4 protein [Desulfamplus sp.]